MTRPLRRASFAALAAASLTLSAAAVRAETPGVAADIAPVHSILAALMEGTGASPALLAPPGASPHGYAMRPSAAAALQGARIAVGVGPALTPWFVDSARTLAPGARLILLAELPAAPEGEAGHATHDDHGHEDHEDHEDHGEHGRGAGDHDEDHGHDDHGHDDHGHDDHGHDDHGRDDDGRDDHADHDHDAHDDHGHDDHAEEDAHAGHAHAHDGPDPHLWLDPHLAASWAAPLAEALAEADPANAALYRANAATLRDRLHALEAEIDEMLAPVRGRPWIAFHDAWSRFETRFDIPSAASAAASDAAQPGPAHISDLRNFISENPGTCVFAEPQLPDRMLAPMVRGTDAKIARIDPLGADLTPGPALYPEILRRAAAALRDCLGG